MCKCPPENQRAGPWKMVAIIQVNMRMSADGEKVFSGVSHSF